MDVTAVPNKMDSECKMSVSSAVFAENTNVRNIIKLPPLSDSLM